MTTTSSTPGKTAKQLHHMITGLTATPPQGVTSLLVHGKGYTLQELLVALSGYAATFDAEEKASAAARAALEARNEIEQDAEHLVQGVRTVLKGMLGKQSVALERYGVRPDKDPTPLTVEQEVLRVAKGKATRKARNTMGPKQKAKIKGQLPPAPPAPSTQSL